MAAIQSELTSGESVVWAAQPKVASCYLDSLPALVDTEDVDFVYRLVSDLREKARTAKATF